jgi:signal transduction histidine kinase/CheY-like chemotaxis protein
MPSTDPTTSTALQPAQALARWRRAAESAHDGLWEVWPRTGETWYSDRFGGLLGLAPGELPADLAALTARIHPEDLPLWRHGWQAAVDDGAPILLQLRLQDRDHRWRWVVLRARCWPGGGAATEVVAGAMTDVHEQFLSQQALEREVAERTASLARAVAEAERRREDAQHAQTAQARFLAHMSHELRTPLAGLLSLVDLARRVATEPPQRRYLEVAMQSGHTLLRTIEQVLDLVRLRDGELPFADEPFDVSEAAAEVLRGVMPLVRSKGLAVHYDWVGEPAWVRGDEPRVRQVLSNLVGNAAKFTERGHIGLRGRIESQGGRAQLHIEVEDSGPGLPPDRIGQVFDPFVQGDASLSRSHGGTGLGLAIARDLARRMGGEITLRSVPGRGSTFALTLPLASAPDPDPAPVAAGGLAWVVFDPAGGFTWLPRRLQRIGWTVELLPDTAAAIEHAGRRGADPPPALVVLVERGAGDVQDLSDLRAALPQAHISLLIRPDWNDPQTERVARGQGMTLDVMPLTPRDLRLMTAPRPDPASAPTATGPAPVAGHVLVVEDNAVNRMIAEEFLHTLGLRARTAEDGAQALEACAAEPPRLVLMDLQMPVMDGLAATRALCERQRRGELPPFPIVALTAHAMDTDVQACRAAGMQGYLTKPLLLDALRAELARWFPELAPS